MQSHHEDTLWPELPYEMWKETLDTLHMWMQIVGKVKLACAPFLNQWWEAALYLTASGITTGPLLYKTKVFQIDFDFPRQVLVIRTNTGTEILLPLQPQSVSDFHKKFFDALNALEIQVKIYPVPVEVANPVPFAKDTMHASYDNAYVVRWWTVQLYCYHIFELFRSSFRGKSSPTHFFWGSFDLNGTRFSGKLAEPPHIDGIVGKIMRLAENEENFAFGFWPGDQRYPHPAFYSYIYPAPKGWGKLHFGKNASFNEQLAECVLPYEAVRAAASPGKEILNFLKSSYVQSATLAGWDIRSLENYPPNKSRTNESNTP